MLPTTVPSVLVIACWAPITSLFIRDMSAPVWVRVKKETCIRWTWSNSFVRMSKMRPSPMRAEYQRCHRFSTALASASPTAPRANQVTRSRSFWGTAVSRRARNSSGGIAITIEAATAVTRKPMSCRR
jgi:hypothetical protein